MSRAMAHRLSHMFIVMLEEEEEEGRGNHFLSIL
jgi:hypothetical protein